MAGKKSNTTARTAAQKREARESAIETLRHGIMHLADVRSLLRRMEYGEDNYFTPEAQATFARATLSDAATEMEQALFDLGLLNREPCGFFVPDLAEQLDARGAA
jgi:hypothetical protein